MDINKPTTSTRTRNQAGGTAHVHDDPRERLRMVTISNLLVNTYYESDIEALEKLHERFNDCVDAGHPEFPLQLAAYARQEMYVRDVPQVLLVFAAHNPQARQYVREYAPAIIARADELCTTLAFNNILWTGQPGPLTVGPDEWDWPTVPYTLKRAVADVIESGAFDEYQYAKYRNANAPVSMHDVYNVAHPWGWDDSPAPTDEQSTIANRITKGDRDDHPDVEPLRQRRTWEDTISAAGQEGQVTADDWRGVLPDMGLFARVRNVRNMLEAGLAGSEIFDGVDEEWVQNSRLYPFRFYQARKQLEKAGLTDRSSHMALERCINWSVANVPDDLSNTLTIVDLSGSMASEVSGRSTLQRYEIGALFGAIFATRGADVIGFGETAEWAWMDSLGGESLLAVQDRILNLDVGHATNAHKALQLALDDVMVDDSPQQAAPWDRVVIFTDMQIWSTHRHGNRRNAMRDVWETYSAAHPGEPWLYMVDLASYGDIKMPPDYPNVRNIQGWSSKVFEYMEHTEGSMLSDIIGADENAE